MILAQATGLGWLEASFVRLFDGGPVGPLAGLGLLLLSAGIGAAHALAPGHGKALMAGYLVGERGRAADAVAFGGIVALLHTVSVTVIAVGLLLLGRTAATRGDLPTAFAHDRWLTLLAGLIVTAVGIALLVRHRRARAAHPHDHHHALPGDVRPLSRRGLVLLAASGGLLPSPSAFLVLSTGLLTGRGAFALLLVAAFSLGLAATITGLGVAVVRGRERVVRRLVPGGRMAMAVALLPQASALAITGIGVVLVGRSAIG